MCGLVAVAGTDSARIGIAALGALTYRGYDSYGWYAKTVAGELGTRAVGEFHGVDERVRLDLAECSVFLGHTRWATRGSVEVRNCHPIQSESGRLLAVHNGGLVGVQEVMASLLRQGVQFRTETDTEVLVNILEQRARGSTLEAAAQWLVDELPLGTDISCVIFDRDEGSLLALCGTGSLVMSTSASGATVCSDVNALEPNGHFESLTFGEIRKITLSDYPAGPPSATPWSPSTSTPRTPGSRMLAELGETAECLPAAIANGARLRAAMSSDHSFVISGMGSSFYSAEFGAQVLADSSGWVVAIQADELCQGTQPTNGAAILVSQSGETFETIEAAQRCRAAGLKTLAITNRRASRLARESDATLNQDCGPELSVLSTKAVTSQMVTMAAAAVSGLGPIQTAEMVSGVRRLQHLPADPLLFELGAAIAGSRYVFVLGSGWLLPIAREFALKIQEGLSLPAQGVSPAALKHGPLALVDESCLAVALSAGSETESAQLEVTLGQVELRAGRAWTVGAPSPVGRGLRLHSLISDALCPLDCCQFLVAQQMAVWLAGQQMGLDVDRPRNLAKTMTVR